MEASFKRTVIRKTQSYSISEGEGKMKESDISVNFHYDHDFAVLYIKKGSGTLRVEGNAYSVFDGDIVITTPYEIHRHEIENGLYQKRALLYVNPSLLRNFDCDVDELFACFNRRPRGIGNVIPASKVKQHKLDSLFDDLFAVAKQNTKKSHALCLCKIIEILSALCDIYDKKIEAPADIHSYDETVRRIIEYINSNLSGDISIEKIAKDFYLSKSRIEHLFKAAAGVSMWDYIILRRLIACNGHIKNGTTVKEAAYQSGFNNYSNFYRLYKKHMNMSPAEYKAKCREV